MIKKLMILLFIVLFSAAIVYAVPPLPDKFSGTATIDGSDAPIGTEIKIFVNNGYKESYNLTEAGYYSFYVKDGNANEPINFKILEQVAGTSTRKGGTKTTLNFAVYTDRDNDGASDSQDKLIGNDGNNIDNNYDDLNLFIEDSDSINSTYSGLKNVKIKNNGQIILEFDFDFDSKVLNLFNLELKKDTGDRGSLIIKGLELPDGKTKTAYFSRTNSTLNSVCVKDIELDDISNISSNCNGDNETKVACDGVDTNGFTCTLTNNVYKITGLRHSGIEQISYNRPAPPPSSDDSSSGNSGSSSPSGGGGSGGSGGGAPPAIISIEKIEQPAEPPQDATQEQTNENNINNDANSDNEVTTSDNQESDLSAITGAVTGNPLSRLWSWWLIPLIAAVVFGILGYQFRASIKSKFSRIKNIKLKRKK